MRKGDHIKYSPEMNEKLRSALAKGYSMAACAGVLGVARSTIYEWIKEIPEFAKTAEIGRAQSALYWEDRLRECAEGGEGNAASIIFGLKNRVPSEWNDSRDRDAADSTGDRVDITFNVSSPVKDVRITRGE